MSLQRLALAFALAAAMPLAQAAGSPTPGDQDLIRERQDRLLEDQRKRLDDLQNLPAPSPEQPAPAAPASSRCFTIDTIELKGADHLPDGDRERLLAPYLHQCLGVAQLNEVLKVITDRYIALGLVTSRAYLPPQDLAHGHLLVQVVEGHLQSLKPGQGSGLSQRELDMGFPDRAGELLDLRAVEQLVDQLNRLPSNQAQMALVPGQTVGSTDVVVNNTARKPWRVALSRSNDGQKSSGEQQWGTRLDWDSPLGLADQLGINGGQDAHADDQHNSHNAGLNYNLPWGWWNFNYAYNRSDYRALAQANSFDFKQRGDSTTHQLKAERVVYRDTLSKTSLSLGLSHLTSNNYVAGSRLDNSSNRITELQYGVNHGRRLGGAFLNLDLGLQQGIGALGAQGEHDPGPADPTARYTKYTATVSYLQPFKLWGEAFSFSSLATGQHSEDVLFSPQRMSLGGESSIRGYKDQFLTGDSGGYWRNDLRWTRPVAWNWLQPVFSEYGSGIGYDQGVISDVAHAGSEHGRVSSDSLELFARGRHLSFSLTLAHSLERPAALRDSEAPVYLRVEFLL
ncbi:ShlB/FhaC/HecB family hemolysin secretion/activation protein [Pseudomonas sp. HR96]|uniref:ShlB/FhaC/HecB family hemolysin secretion/activation protein n=1 Tax=Pseudomonas sp. HR96 TaxID=1027966 RepID=UPI0039BEC886